MNNYTEADETAVSFVGADYTVYGKEVGESGTPHLQGYLYFKNSRTFKSLSKKLPRAHIEVRKGSHTQARDYCIKDGDVTEYGTPPMTPKEKGINEKKRYERAWDLAKLGKVEDIDADIRMRLYGTIKRIRKDYQVVPESIEELDNRWYHGSTGTGKSKSAREEFPDAYLKNANKWWDGYVDQETVIIDEWDPIHSVLGTHLKQWADHHPFAAESKGGMLCIRPKRIIITSNYTIEECFDQSQNYIPLMRRFKQINFPINK